MSNAPQDGTHLGTDARLEGQGTATATQAQDSPRPRRRRGLSVPAPVEVGAPEAGSNEPSDAGDSQGPSTLREESRGDDRPGLDPAPIAPSLEAVLFSTDRAVPASRLAEVLEPSFPGLTNADLKRVVAHLNADYERQGRSFRIEAISGGLRVMTLPRFADVLARFHGQRAQTRLSRAAIETLAIIAYKQPIARAQVEAIRGVASGDIIKTLMERRLVTITGRAEEVGRPMLYGTTRQFLEVFGLASLKDLPPPEEFGLGAAQGS